MKTKPTGMIVLSLLLAVSMILFVTTDTIAQEAKKFALRGATELGGSIGFTSVTPVTNGNTGSATTAFSIAPFIGYFVADGFELGVNPLGIAYTSYSGGGSVTQVMIFFAPSYNFSTQSIVYPFIEALLGYTSASASGGGSSATASGFSWGGRGGIKVAVTDKGLLNFGLEYYQITENPSSGGIYGSDRYGYNQISVSAGFTIWF
jgi:hypothetical protein